MIPAFSSRRSTTTLSDQRYLPFEGAGAISSWHFEMPAANNEIVARQCHRRGPAPLLHRPRRRQMRFKQGVLHG